MRPWQILWKTEALILAVLVGCSATSPVVRVESGTGGQTLVHIPRTAAAEPVEVPPEEVTQAIRRLARDVRLSGTPRETVEKLFQLDALYGDYLYLLRERKLVPLESGTPLEGTLTEEEQELVSRYKGWCRSAHGFEGDCLGGALVGGKYLDTQGRYMLAMALSKSPVLEEFEKALGEMVSMRAVMQAAMATIVTLLVLLAMPEPVTKFIAAWATVGLIRSSIAECRARLLPARDDSSPWDNDARTSLCPSVSSSSPTTSMCPIAGTWPVLSLARVARCKTGTSREERPCMWRGG